MERNGERRRRRVKDLFSRIVNRIIEDSRVERGRRENI